MPQPAIIGAGLAGLLAANMLRRHQPYVLERQSDLPNNHHAVLRFRSEGVSRQLHIPFREVQVFKSCDDKDPVAAALRYSKKVLGRYEVRSLINLAPATRYIAPPDLVSQMADGVNIQFNVEFAPDCRWPEPVISTIPMAMLMDLLEYEGERPEFVSMPGWTVTATIEGCDAFVTRYYTSAMCPAYRVSVTGDQLIIEGTGDPPAQMSIENMIVKLSVDLGIRHLDIGRGKLHQGRYAKIGHLSPADRRKAKDFMFWATRERGIYSLGRFATWRAGLLLDDLVNDILMIERWIIFGPTPYEIKLHTN